MKKRFFDERARERDRAIESGEGKTKEGLPGSGRVRRGFDPSRGGKDACLSLSRRSEWRGWRDGGGGRRDADGLAALPGRRVAG